VEDIPGGEAEAGADDEAEADTEEREPDEEHDRPAKQHGVSLAGGALLGEVSGSTR